MTPPPDKFRLSPAATSWGMAVGLMIATCMVYAPSFHGTWLWDDNSEITTNLDLRGPWWGIWTAPAGPDYLPLKTTVQWFQWRWWGLDSTVGYHLTNVVLHALSSFLVWRLFRRLGLRFAAWGAFLFAVHPLAVESVAWIAELKNALSLPAFLCAGLAWMEFDQSRKTSAYVGSLLWFVLSLLCKGSVVMLPVMLLFYGWWRRAQCDRRDFKTLAPFFAVSVAAGLTTIWFQSHHTGWEVSLGSLASRIGIVGSALGFYVGKFFWPFGLMPIYPDRSVDLITPAAWLPLMVTALTAALGWTFRARWGRSLLFVLGSVVAALLPVLGLVPMAYFHLSWVADHLSYLALVPLLGATIGVAELIEKHPSARAGLVPALVYAAVGCVLAWQARAYAATYQSSESLWSYAVRKDAHSWLALNNLGVVRLEQERWDEALGLFRASIGVKGDFAPAHSNSGTALARLQRATEATLEFQQALRFEPDSVDANYNYANTLVELGQFAASIDYYETALRSAPGSVDVRFNLGRALMHLERWESARAQFGEVLRLRPDSIEGRLGLGNVFAASGQMTEASVQFLLAVAAQPASVEAQYCLADVYVQLRRLAEGLEHYRIALQLAPLRTDIRLAYADALLSDNRPAEAETEFRRVLALRPENQEARAGLQRVRIDR